MSELRFPTVATILGNPVYWDSPHRDHTPEQLASLKALGVNTLFVNLAWSRPWMDAVTLEEVHVSPTYPWLSDPARVATNAPRLRRRTDAVAAAGLRPFFLFGCPTQIDLGSLPPEAQARCSLDRPTASRITPGVAVACIQSPAVRQLYANSGAALRGLPRDRRHPLLHRGRAGRGVRRARTTAQPATAYRCTSACPTS